MINLFKKKTPVEKLNKEYKKLLHEAFVLSTTNRELSDQKYADADLILKQIDELK